MSLSVQEDPPCPRSGGTVLLSLPSGIWHGLSKPTLAGAFTFVCSVAVYGYVSVLLTGAILTLTKP